MQRISYQGFNNNYATFKAGSSLRNGKPVKLDESGRCTEALDNDAFFGVCASIRSGLAAVQLQGYFELEYSGDDPKYGLNKFVCDGNGGVTIASQTADTMYVKVVKIDKENHIVGFIL